MVVRDELLRFHKKWYSSNIMGLTILGQQVQQQHHGTHHTRAAGTAATSWDSPY